MTIALPDLILLEDFQGNWEVYLDRLHNLFEQDFLLSKPAWPVKRFAVKRHPEISGKSATFWHLIQEGSVEEERTPCPRRCERIRWPRKIIEACDFLPPTHTNGSVLWWKNERKGKERILICLPDFSYIVVIDERNDFVMLWTAYLIVNNHKQRKMEKEYKEYWGL